MHPLSVETFEPYLFEGIDDKLFKTKELMYQIYLNLIKNGVDNAKEMFSDDNFINKIRFKNTEEIITLEPVQKSLWDIKYPNVPSNKLVYYIMPEIPQIHGVYVCKTEFNGKTILEHFIVYKTLALTMTVRVNYNDYPDSMFNSLQTLISNNDKHITNDMCSALIKLMMRDEISIELEEAMPHSPSFMYNILRIATETVKRIAYV